VLDNPRLFVMDSNNELTLPLLLKGVDTTQERCNTIRDANGNVIQEECWDIEEQTTTFL
jgi:hypothetical protein